MSCSRVQISLTGLPTALATATACTVSSGLPRRPKPPPTKLTWTKVFSGAIPATPAAACSTPPGAWVETQMSNRSFCNHTVAFKGSIAAWAW